MFSMRQMSLITFDIKDFLLSEIMASTIPNFLNVLSLSACTMRPILCRLQE